MLSRSKTAEEAEHMFSPLELHSFKTLSVAAKIRGVSTDTLKREDDRRAQRGEARRIVQLSARLLGMRLKDILEA